MASGVLPQGFVLKTLDEIIGEMNDAFRNAYGTDLDVSPDTPNGQIIGIMANQFSELWLLGQSVYDAFNPNTAFGISLSNVVQLNDLERQEPQKSTVDVVITGVPLTFIPAAGTLIQTSDTGNNFTIADDVSIPGSGTITVTATAQEDGQIAAPAGTLTVIVTPITGWTGVNNPDDAVLGRATETDPELRVRRQNSTTLRAQSILDAMLTDILAIPAVQDARVYENNTGAVDSNGFLPNSVAAVVEGGDVTDIATQIKNNDASGIPTNGDVEVFLPNNAGVLQPYYFYRPNLLEIHVQVNVNVLTGFPNDGLFQIEQAVFDYLTGIDQCTGEDTGKPVFGIGDNVVVSQIYTPVNTIPGQSVQSILVGIGAATSPNDIVIPFDGLPSFQLINIVAASV